MYDSIVVGFGIAGIAVTGHLHVQGKKVLVVDANEVKASVVAAGMFNPVILKRFSMAWNGDEQLEYAKVFYKNLEEKLQSIFIEPMNVLRKFNSTKEQNSWFSKLDNPVLSKYMSGELFQDSIMGVDTPYDCGILESTGRILIKDLIDKYLLDLKNENAFVEEVFDFSMLKILNNHIEYKGFKARNVVFCEGYNLRKNPFFKNLPLIGNKGSYIVIECEGLKLTKALKAHFFLIPLGADQYKFGATYENHFKNVDHDTAAKANLVEELEKLISVPYRIICQQTGVRPTVIDRRPLVGRHSKYNRLFVCNGMGTRGVMIAPTAAKHLVSCILEAKPIPKEMNINRFEQA